MTTNTPQPSLTSSTLTKDDNQPKTATTTSFQLDNVIIPGTPGANQRISHFDLTNFETEELTLRSTIPRTSTRSSGLVEKIKLLQFKVIQDYDEYFPEINNFDPCILLGDISNLINRQLFRTLTEHNGQHYLIFSQPSLDNDTANNVGFSAKYDLEHNLLSTHYTVQINGATVTLPYETYPDSFHFNTYHIQSRFRICKKIKFSQHGINWDIIVFERTHFKQYTWFFQRTVCDRLEYAFDISKFTWRMVGSRVKSFFTPLNRHLIQYHKNYFASLIQSDTGVSINIHENKEKSILNKVKSSLAQGEATQLCYSSNEFERAKYYSLAVLIYVKNPLYVTMYYDVLSKVQRQFYSTIETRQITVKTPTQDFDFVAALANYFNPQYLRNDDQSEKVDEIDTTKLLTDTVEDTNNEEKLTELDEPPTLQESIESPIIGDLVTQTNPLSSVVKDTSDAGEPSTNGPVNTTTDKTPPTESTPGIMSLEDIEKSLNITQNSPKIREEKIKSVFKPTATELHLSKLPIPLTRTWCYVTSTLQLLWVMQDLPVFKNHKEKIARYAKAFQKNPLGFTKSDEMKALCVYNNRDQLAYQEGIAAMEHILTMILTDENGKEDEDPRPNFDFDSAHRICYGNNPKLPLLAAMLFTHEHYYIIVKRNGSIEYQIWDGSDFRDEPKPPTNKRVTYIFSVYDTINGEDFVSSFEDRSKSALEHNRGGGTQPEILDDTIKPLRQPCHIPEMEFNTHPILVHHDDIEKTPLVNSLGPDIQPKSTTAHVLDFGSGSVPDTGDEGKIQAYLLRYHNPMGTVDLKEHPDIDKYMDEFAEELSKIVGPQTPCHSEKAEKKYEEWLCDSKLLMFPEKMTHDIFVKNEVYDKVNRNRLITNCDKATTINLLKFVTPLHEACSLLLNGYAPGKDKADLHIHNIPEHIGMDCAGLDGTISLKLRMLEYKILGKVYPQHKKEVYRLLDNELFGVFDVGNINKNHLTVPTMAARLSGSALTSYGNSMLMLFLMYYFNRVKRNMSPKVAMANLGYGYGDDTTFPAKLIPVFAKFVKSLGINITVEKSSVDGVCFLSENTTAEGKSYQLTRLCAKSTAFFTKFTYGLGFLYKLMGYYNPGKPIVDYKSSKFSQAPVFSSFGYVALEAYRHYLKDISRLSRKSTEIIEAKHIKNLSVDYYYDVLLGHDPVSYDDQFNGICAVHRKSHLDAVELLIEYTSGKLKFTDFICKLTTLFVNKVRILWPLDERVAILNNTKTVSFLDSHPMNDSKIVISTDLKPMFAFFEDALKLIGDERTLGLLNKTVKFWKTLDILCRTKQLNKSIGAAAKKNYNQLLLYQTNFKYTLNAKNKQTIKSIKKQETNVYRSRHSKQTKNRTQENRSCAK